MIDEIPSRDEGAPGIESMAESTVREQYIPLRRNELIDLLCRDGLSEAEQYQLRTISRLLASLYHFEFLRTIEEVTNDYAPFDPDRETLQLKDCTPTERIDRLDKLFTTFGFMLQKANYQPITEEQLHKAMDSRSRWGLTMSVDFSIFDRLAIYVRGDTTGRRSFRNWKRFWKVEHVEIPVYRRLVLMLKLREQAKGRIGTEVNSEGVYLKAFKDIPQDDLEMLLPGARLRMNKFDKTKMTFPVLTFIVTAFWNVIFVPLLKFIGFAFVSGPAGAAGAVGLWTIAVGSGAYGYRSYASYNFTKNQYSLQLTRSLYYQNLDNNAGVFYSLLNEAEHQEWREAILGYFYLLRRAPEEGATAAEVDTGIEAYLEKHARLRVDFEVRDAVQKLERLKLLTCEDGRYSAVPLAEAVERMHETWDEQFRKMIRPPKPSSRSGAA